MYGGFASDINSLETMQGFELTANVWKVVSKKGGNIMGANIIEIFMFYGKEKTALEKFNQFLWNSSNPEEIKSGRKHVFATEDGNDCLIREMSMKTPKGEELGCRSLFIDKVRPAENPEDDWEFKLGCETRNHSNFAAFKELCAEYGVNLCYNGGSSEAGIYMTYDPEGRYWKRNFEDYRFSNPYVYILFERKKVPSTVSEKENQEITEYFNTPVKDVCERVHYFFADKNINNKVFKINENAFYVELRELKLASPFIPLSLEQIKINLKAMSNILNFSMSDSFYLNGKNSCLASFKTSLYFYIASGTSSFKGLQPDSFKWAMEAERFQYESEFVCITNDKNTLFFSELKNDDFCNYIDCSVVTGENESSVEEIKEVNKETAELLFEYPKCKNRQTR